MGSDLPSDIIARTPEIISIHAPRMGSDHRLQVQSAEVGDISIHAPRMGSDFGFSIDSCKFSENFNPRSPHGERRPHLIHDVCHIVISIHAPRMGSDRLTWGEPSRTTYFNPRSPHGERHVQGYLSTNLQKFQSTLPAWGATIALFV